MKLFLLIAGSGYYPSSGTEDWIDTFKTYEEAENLIKIISNPIYYTKGPKKGEVKETYDTYEIRGRKYDWYNIVNLHHWINKD